MQYADFTELLSGRSLPLAMVDLDAMYRNVDRFRRLMEGSGKTLRVASKSVRHLGLLRRILERGGPSFRGLMCFTLQEAVFLSNQGFDDLLVAYPSIDPHGLAAVAERVAAGATIRLMADSRRHLSSYANVARKNGVELEIVLDLDVALRPLTGRVHLGVLRSSLRSAEALRGLVIEAQAIEGVTIVGLMGYEAHIAGLPDENPFSRALNPVRKVLKRRAIPAVKRQRRLAVEALVAAGGRTSLVNGGGTGSIHSTLNEACLTEVTVGSGFLCSHLFDYYADLDLEPAAFFALEVSRIPEAGVITCLGGGYVASGEPGWDKLPIPWLPKGLSYVSMEGAGEVQTPLRLNRLQRTLAIGDPIVFRHAKAGELAERFDAYALIEAGQIVATEPTYRGMQQTFL